MGEHSTGLLELFMDVFAVEIKSGHFHLKFGCFSESGLGLCETMLNKLVEH
jgi:hypothetical protein